MIRNSLKALLLVLLFLVAGILAFHLPQASQSSSLAIKLALLWVMVAGFHYSGYPTLSRVAVAIAVTAFVSPFFGAKGIRFGLLSLFSWMGIFLILLLGLIWREAETRLPKSVINSTLLLLLFMAVPMLFFFQLNPLLDEVYAQPMAASLMNFLPIPIGFAAFMLALQLRRDAVPFIVLGAPLLIPIILGLSP